MGLDWWEIAYSCLQNDLHAERISDQITRIMALSAATLSLVGTSFVMTHFMWKGKASEFSSFLVFFLSLADFGSSVNIIVTDTALLVILPPQDIDTNSSPATALPLWFCYVSRTLFNFFGIASLCWTTCIAISLFLAIVWESPVFLPRSMRNQQGIGLLNKDRRRRGKRRGWGGRIRETLFGYDRILIYVFNIVAWLFSLSLSLSMYFGHMYHQTMEGWCEPTKPLGDLLFWTLPACIFFGLNLFLYAWITISLNIKKRREPGIVLHRLSKVVRKRVSAYVFVYLICWAPDVVVHLLPYFTDCNLFILYALTALVNPLQGFLNCVVYALTNSGLQRKTSKKRLALIFLLSPLLVIPSFLYLLIVRWAWRLAGYAFGQVLVQPNDTSEEVIDASEFPSCVDYGFDSNSGAASVQSIPAVVDDQQYCSSSSDEEDVKADPDTTSIDELLFGYSSRSQRW